MHVLFSCIVHAHMVMSKHMLHATCYMAHAHAQVFPSGEVAINSVRRLPLPHACASSDQDGKQAAETRPASAGLATRPSPPTPAEPTGETVGEEDAPLGSGSHGSGLAQVTGEAATQVQEVPAGSVFVLGDCPARSTDSRFWGALPVENIVARPVLRIWPLDRKGSIDASS